MQDFMLQGSLPPFRHLPAERPPRLLVRNLGLLLVKVKAQPHEEPIGLEARHLLSRF